MMRITCPQCGFFRELPDSKVPVTSTMATCPKCRHRFRFRPDVVASGQRGGRDTDPRAGMAASSAEEQPSSWRRPPQSAPVREPAHTMRQEASPPAAPPAREPAPSMRQEAAPPAEPPVREPARAMRQEAAPPADPPAFSSPPPLPEPEPETPPRRSWETRRGAASPPAPEPTAFREETPPEVYEPRPRKPQPSAAPVPEPEETPALGPTAAAFRLPADHTTSVAPDARPAAGPDAGPDAGLDHGPEPAPEPIPEPTPRAVSAKTSQPDARAGRTEWADQADQADGTGQGRPASGVDKDGVRDIWAKLQALDNDAPPHASRSEAKDPEPEAEAAPPVTDPIPWECQEGYGFFPGLLLTLRKILLQPQAFFAEMPEGRPKGKALVFNLLISEFLFVIDFVWTLMGLRAGGHNELSGTLPASPGLSLLFVLLLVPPALTVGVYLDAWLTQLLLLLFRNARKSFSETFRVLCYSAAPTALLAVPVAGQILSPVILVWYMALQAIGLKKIHDGAYTQILAAVFIKWSLYLFMMLAVLQSLTPGS